MRTPTFRPRRVPEETAHLNLRLTYRGQLFNLEISTREAKYTLIEGSDLALKHEDEAIRLTADSPVVVRPVKAREVTPTFDEPQAAQR